jgi:hypothetical protein
VIRSDRQGISPINTLKGRRATAKAQSAFAITIRTAGSTADVSVEQPRRKTHERIGIAAGE